MNDGMRLLKISGRGTTAFYQEAPLVLKKPTQWPRYLLFHILQDQYTAFFPKALSVLRIHRRSSHDMRMSPLLGMCFDLDP